MGSRKPCINCLLRDIKQDEVYDSLRRYIESFDPEIKVEENLYEYRLTLCKECDYLRDGICGKCGCFVEARALKKSAGCPHEQPRW